MRDVKSIRCYVIAPICLKKIEKAKARAIVIVKEFLVRAAINRIGIISLAENFDVMKHWKITIAYLRQWKRDRNYIGLKL